MQKLVTVDKVPVIVDGMMSATALPAAPICRENKVVFIGTLTSHPEVTSPGGYIYRIAASDVINANVEAKFAYNVLKKRKAAGLTATTDYGVRFKKIVQERFEKLGGSWVASDEFPQGGTDYRTQLAKIKEKNPGGGVRGSHPQRSGADASTDGGAGSSASGDRNVNV
jgi:branched-chain amino acid transport system substrate-binding protein